MKVYNLRQQGSNGLRQFPWEVGKDMELLEITEGIWLRSEKRRVYSVNGRHYDDR